MKVIEYIGIKAIYDKDCQKVFGVDKDGKMQVLCDIRGWGAIQHLFKCQKKAINFQDDVGEFISNSINEKLKKND